MVKRNLISKHFNLDRKILGKIKKDEDKFGNRPLLLIMHVLWHASLITAVNFINSTVTELIKMTKFSLGKINFDVLWYF